MPKTTMLEYKEINVTPAIAQKFLDGNVDFNRKKRDTFVKRYMMSMLEGLWRINGQDILIGIDSTGKQVLLNGQHRLKAVIEAGQIKKNISIPMGFKFGVPIGRDVFETIDASVARSAADFIAGENKIPRGFATHIAACVRLHYLYTQSSLGSERNLISPQQLVRYYRIHPELEKNMRFLNKDIRVYGCLMPISAAGFLFTIFNEKDKKLSERFMDRLIVGENLTKTNPVFQARELLKKIKEFKGVKGAGNYKLKICMEAWNMVRQNKRGKLEVPEEFPEVI